MKKLEVIIAKIMVIITYYLTFLVPIKKKRISFISYFNNELGLEFTKLNDLLINDGYEIKYSLRQFKGNALGKLTYLFSFVYQTYLFNTSRIIILDGNNFVHATIKAKKGVETVQLWHATGAIKKFGTPTKRRYEIKGYDHLIVASAFFKEIFAKALNTKIENVYDLGVCKTDYLFDAEFIEQKKASFYQTNPHLKDKKIILYAPTFRGEGIEDVKLVSDIGQMKNYLADDYHLLVKLHPLITKYDLSEDVEITKDDLYTLLCVADFVISDYSALIFDAVLLNKRIILYLNDFEQYEKERGLCLNLAQLPLKKGYTINDVCAIIMEYEEDVDNSSFVSEYLLALDGKSTERIYRHIKVVIEKER